ncbi:MAG: NADH-ubiquinone oxidoreductase-F iron-sulfur binding region domain-containing protein [Microthrixaceae bacterium]
MINRVLDATPCTSLADHLAAGGGRAVAEAHRLGGEATIELVEASGLRGRGGAGFPTGVKWRTVDGAASDTAPTPVVVNAAEGEPGTFKDRMLIRRNPYKVIEGALVAAVVLGAREVVIATKASFTHEVRLLRRAIAEIEASSLASDVAIRLVLGPDSYLFGEETALLEVVEGRQPFPRIAPPYRRGLDPNEVSPQRNASRIRLAGGTEEPPALVDNVETFANIAAIVTEGPEWFRSLGTSACPGTLICTVTGHTRRHGVGEYPMGTPLSQVIDELGGGARPDRTLIAAISGVANPVLPPSAFGTPLSYESMSRIGSGLGAGGFIVFDDSVDPVAVAEGIAHFLAVESCGQCTPCKADGLSIAATLGSLRTTPSTPRIMAELTSRLDTVVRGARCYLAHQQQRTVSSLLDLFPGSFAPRPDLLDHPVGTELIAPVVDIVGYRAVLDSEYPRKQPDWTYNATDSGTVPAARYSNTPLTIRPHAPKEQPNLRPPSSVAQDEPAFDRIRAVHRDLDEILDHLDDAGPRGGPTPPPAVGAGTSVARRRHRAGPLPHRLAQRAGPRRRRDVECRACGRASRAIGGTSAGEQRRPHTGAHPGAA